MQRIHLKTSPNCNMVESSLEQAIKKSNVKSYIRKGLGPDSKTQAAEPDENQAILKHLLSLKKSCSDLSKEIKLKDKGIERLQDETIFSYQNVKKATETRQNMLKTVQQLQKDMEKIQSKKQTAFHCTKTYQHLLDRIKKDSVYNQLKNNTLELQLKAKQKQKGIIQAKQYSTFQSYKLSTTGLRDANQQFVQQSRFRSNNETRIYNQTNQKLQKKQKLQQRQRKAEQIQQLAAGDIQDNDLIKLKKFMTVQKFYKEMLKFKMTKLKEHFEPFQRAFFSIKSNTNVRDAASLKTQFFNFEKSYNQKTVWVSHLESEIQEAEQQRAKLQQKLNNLKTSSILQFDGDSQQSAHNNLKQLSLKSQNHQRIWQRIQTWLTTQTHKMNINQQQDPENKTKIFHQLLLNLSCEQKDK